MLALLAIADWANDDGICWPRLGQLARKARLTPMGARYCLRRLLKEGVVTVEKNAKAGQPRTLKISGQYLPKSGAVSASRGGSDTASPRGSDTAPAYKEEPSLTVKDKIQKSGKVLDRERRDREANLAEAKRRGLA